MNALIVGYDLLGFVDGSTTCPSPSHDDYNYWRRQDQLLLHAIISSVDQQVVCMLGNVMTSKQAWDTLTRLFASKTRHRIMYLKEKLSRSSKGSQTITAYLQGIKSVSDELAIIDCPVDDLDLVIHTLNGLGSEFKEIAAVIRTHETPITFDELHDLLHDFETYLHRDAPSSDITQIATANSVHKGKTNHFKAKPQSSSSGFSSFTQSTFPSSSKKVVCQFCKKPGHTAKVCYKIHGFPNKQGYKPYAHHNFLPPPTASPDWVLDSGATHHVTNDFEQLHLTTPYNGKDQLHIGDGTALPISHTGNTNIITPSHTLHLNNVLHVPNIATHLLSISKLCQTNPVSVEFFSDYFLVKDLKTGTPLLKGQHKNGLYHLPTASSPQVLFSAATPP